MKSILGLKCVGCRSSGRLALVSKKFLFVNIGSKSKFGSGLVGQNEKNGQVTANVSKRTVFIESNVKNNHVQEEQHKSALPTSTDESTFPDKELLNSYIDEQRIDAETQQGDYRPLGGGEDVEAYAQFDRYDGRGKDDGENGFMSYNRKERPFNNHERGRNRQNHGISGGRGQKYQSSSRYNNMEEEDYESGKSNSRRTSYSRNLNSQDRYDQLGENLKDIEWNKVDAKVQRQNLLQDVSGKKADISPEQLDAELKRLNIYMNNESGVLNNLASNFSDVNFHEAIVNHLNAKFKEPTAIQKVTWPIALSGKDLIGVAETGSGKTLAFALPGLMHILKQRERQVEKENGWEQGQEGIGEKTTQEWTNESMQGATQDAVQGDTEGATQRSGDRYVHQGDRTVYGLILLPTRELCMQVVDEIKIFEKELDIRSVAVYGGVPKYTQINNLKKGADIVVATPGRLLDLLENGVIHLLRCIYVVIDEADRLLDMGFEKQLKKIMTQVNKNKQLLFFTATWPEQVRQLAYDFSSLDPVKIQVGKSELTANKNIEQSVIVSSSIDLKKKLLDWLKQNYEGNKILIFCDTKRNCDNLCKELRYHQYNALAIHGDKEQRERDRILNNYRSDRCNILVATDVASRGLDIKNISIVVNYDLPNTIEDYIHRIGRTGRAGKKGKAVLFFPYDYYVPQKSRFARDLVKLLNKANHAVPAELREIAGTR
ncbi:ATP-dependent RNA helicase, putative [Plasmodium knowlesi strain H]|uniref:RNA helicase n=3 Tax=Plasmodium knowlesi TaxID=5850 RepID=A0A5K1UEB2_PLAKH|nr:DNA helicase 60, putative [Plasmodium knowlesi strain H]OTN63971.1 putative ATP-dependent RNA helicase [Plasmodium knowlesi]CAA9991060.1 DNA helicase 60, putative [Plasmodium knowlesi strain H]SBO20651.1 ATP-dependent RNA helicase, putative [Plasmodium knowlesi strain H]SBO21068.1 ATP-dependent RNA helicase, putative [Plasmodium knowlesi strain H]VVS80534.1 DNA helicase 60, putative [Plasmodium knowlesi strain H]|eukprot:XP_002262342.1 ATP-dependent RNA helicase, putative [Plasmodium knowlesi strain H]